MAFPMSARAVNTNGILRDSYESPLLVYTLLFQPLIVVVKGDEKIGIGGTAQYSF